MIIGIEAERANNPYKTGVEHYAKQLILHLAEIDHDNQYVLYLRTKPEDWFLKLPDNFKIKVLPFPIFWTQLRLSYEMFQYPVDVLFIPASALPLLHPKKTVVTIHDLGWRFYPETFTWFNRNFLELSTWFAVTSASSIISVSEATKKDLVKEYSILPERITVISHGYEKQAIHAFVEKSGDELRQLESSVILPEKYILFLSTLQPRKNLAGLIEAFNLLKKEMPELKHKLVVVGKPGWKFEPILELIQENSENVLYLNHVSDSDRFTILKQAEMVVLPSFYEGFGMQILESFSMNVPVVVSKVSSMPEVAGEAALYFDPHNTAEIKNAMKMVLSDKGLRDSLILKGAERLKKFSWEKCALETLEVLKT